ncbi:MAG: transposase family protein [Streptococcaceae bacterium]|jgi:hypothetical protein|nr:transposase family protein [Streptococcaceae bacterium]
MTAEEKRKVQEGFNFLVEFENIQNIFLPELKKWLSGVKDPRNLQYTTYPAELLLYVMIIKHATGLFSMRRMTEKLNNDNAIQNMKEILGLPFLEKLPHHDTINDFLKGLEISELEEIRIKIIKKLLQDTRFHQFMIRANRLSKGKNGCWSIIVDGTCLYSFNQRHCEHCLTRTHKNKKGEQWTEYYHNVLEFKLRLGDMVMSIHTEFIENETTDISKQDCELNAFYRAEKALAANLEGIPVCLQADSLYACEPVFQICTKNHWDFLIRLKDNRLKTVTRLFKESKNKDKVKWKITQKNKKTGEDTIFHSYFANEIEYKKGKINVLEVVEMQLDGKEHKLPKRFFFITSFKITKNNQLHLALQGRARWKIENEGFNRQKNSAMNIQHLNCHDYDAMKNHYLLSQISDILMQLYEKGVELFKVIKKTVKEKAEDLLEVIRTHRLTVSDLKNMKKNRQVLIT